MNRTLYTKMTATIHPNFDHHTSILAHLLGEAEDDMSRPSTPLMFTALATPSAYDSAMTQRDVRISRKQRKRHNNNNKEKVRTVEQKIKLKQKKKLKRKGKHKENKNTSTTPATTSASLNSKSLLKEESSTIMSFTSDGKQYDLAGNLITPRPSVPKTTPSQDIIPRVPDSEVKNNETTVNPSNTTSKTSDKVSDTLSSSKPLHTTLPSTNVNKSSTTNPPNVINNVTNNPHNGITPSTIVDPGFDPAVFLDNITDSQISKGGDVKDGQVTQGEKVKDGQQSVDDGHDVTEAPPTTSSSDINIFIFPGRNKKKNKERKWKKKLERQMSCPFNDFKSRGERQCCLKSAKCFQNFPDDLDEFAKHNHQPGEQVDSVAACGHIDDALLCMSRVFRREECRATAVVVNKNLKEELTIVKKIYKNHCHGTTTPNPIPKTTSNSPGGQGLMTSAQGGSLPMGALIAAGVGGLLVLLLIILIVVLVKRRKRPMDGRSDEKVMFENSSNASSRYKSFTRKNSDVYAEIDERALANMQQENNNSSTISNSMTSLDGRPLPSAPGKEDKTGYLTPRSMSKEIITEVPGYDELAHSQSETGSPSYDKLELNKSEEVQDYEEQVPRHDDGDCEYITPTSDNAPQVQTKPDDTYHTYFVLEK